MSKYRVSRIRRTKGGEYLMSLPARTNQVSDPVSGRQTTLDEFRAMAEEFARYNERVGRGSGDVLRELHVVREQIRQEYLAKKCKE